MIDEPALSFHSKSFMRCRRVKTVARLRSCICPAPTLDTAERGQQASNETEACNTILLLIEVTTQLVLQASGAHRNKLRNNFDYA